MAKNRHVTIIDPNCLPLDLEAIDQIKAKSKLPLRIHQPYFNSDSLRGESYEASAGLILMGSEKSANSNAKWLRELEEFILGAIHKEIPILAICFSHQLVAKLMGGTVSNIPEPEIKELKPVASSDSKLQSSNTGYLLYAHGEYVAEPPKNTKPWIVDHSPYCSSLEYQEKPIWSLQGHPEALFSFAEKQGITIDHVGSHINPFDFGQKIIQDYLTLLNH